MFVGSASNIAHDPPLPNQMSGSVEDKLLDVYKIQKVTSYRAFIHMVNNHLKLYGLRRWL